MNLGLTLGIITIITIGLIFGLHKWTYKVTRTYYFNIVLGAACFIYFLVVRYIPEIQEFNKYFSGTNHHFYKTSLRWSKILLLDMCPLSFVLLTLSMIFDKTKSISKVLAPVALLGGLITIFGQITWDNIDAQLIKFNVTWYEYIFIGRDVDNKMYFMMHYLLIICSLINILNCKTYTRYSFYGTSAFYIGWMIYMQICINILPITNNATGLVYDDWFAHNGEYRKMAEIIPMSFPAIVIFWFFFALVYNFLVCMLRNISIKNEDFLFKNESWWYQNVKWLNNTLRPIDDKISIKINYILKHKHDIH